MSGDVAAQLQGKSTIWIKSVSSWSGKDKLTAADLVELLGDRYEDFFETALSLKVKDGFNRRIYQV